MHRNVTIVVIILIFVVIAAYLIWLRSRFEQPAVVESNSTSQAVIITPSPIASQSASPSATPISKQATSSAKPKTASPSSIKK